MFMNEIITKTVREESHAHELCEFLIDSFITLDQQSDQTENFHLIFLLKLSRLLGFGAHTRNDVLNIRVAGDAVEKLLDQLIHANYGDPFSITVNQRRELLDLLVKFYSDHIDTLGEIKSIQVLREVMT
jgi:DNA repair protein RecO (recombination protein O)